MLRCDDPVRARLIGFMEWMPYEVSMALVANVAGRGYDVRC